MKKVGVLSLQGDFAAHGAALERAGAEPVYVREREQLDGVDGLIIPGGESTTMLKLLRYENLLEALREFGRKKPVFGTCAGAILLAREVSHPEQESLGLMDIAVERNGYGRQLDSRVVKLAAGKELGDVEAVFIRAPIIRRVGENVKVIATYEKDPVLVDDGRHLAATFHPELTSDSRIHELFLEKL
ncbi:MAG TPA: pyridoxal 5'-phosphate synthase glutaminase subunit PdxT [Candidatus Limnocylindrales bacterium]|nr:pyridoxal 5'-phosphate synthase glutaminase subunit PdxT [Candidatus Limnocylindrales bacterium]